MTRLTRGRADGFTLYWSFRNMPWKLTFASPPVGCYLSPALSTVASVGGGRNGSGEGRLVCSTRRVALTHNVPGLNADEQAFTAGRSAHRSQVGAQFLYIFISSFIIIIVLHTHTFDTGQRPPPFHPKGNVATLLIQQRRQRSRQKVDGGRAR